MWGGEYGTCNYTAPPPNLQMSEDGSSADAAPKSGYGESGDGFFYVHPAPPTTTTPKPEPEPKPEPAPTAPPA